MSRHVVTGGNQAEAMLHNLGHVRVLAEPHRSNELLARAGDVVDPQDAAVALPEHLLQGGQYVLRAQLSCGRTAAVG